MEYVVGIDIGTGSLKALALTLKGETFEVSQQHYSSGVPQPGFHEQNPEDIWAAFVLTLQDLLHKISYPPQAISFSSAMHSLIPTDENGKALAPMMTWADNRSSAIATSLKSTEKGMEIYKATGTPVHSMSPLCKVIWLRENDASIFNKTKRYISIKEYIWYKLFKEFEVDYSIASSTGLFDIQLLNWHAEALKLAGISEGQLSSPVSTAYQRKFQGHPEIKGLEKGTPFFIGASDGCLANLGSLAYTPGLAVITVGTSGAIRMASPSALYSDKAMTFSYILDDQTFVCGGPINNGGIALQWWLKHRYNAVPDDEGYKSFFQEIKIVAPGSNGLIFLPYLTGERAPIWDSESCGTFFGVKLQHEPAHFSRAVVEGICFALKSVLEALEEKAGPVSHIYISGGFVKSKVWVQILADITGKSLVLVQAEDASAVGAAFLALKGLGHFSRYPVACLEGLKVISPDLQNTVLYASYFAIYKKLYLDLKETMHQLHQLNH